jgi:hypothetical protein
MIRRLLALSLLVLFPIVPAARAQSLEEVRDAVVIVVARGVDTGNGNAEVVVQGTGFFVNSNGMLVTSHHLIEKLGPTVHEPSIEFTIHFDAMSAAVPARKIYASPEGDVMVLYAPVGSRNVRTLKPARRSAADIRLSTTPVYAAGYAAGYDFSLDPGFVTSWNGPLRPLIPSWLTDHAFSEGQSGSPIVLADGRVVAVAKAADADNVARGIVVPIDFIPTQYWDETESGREVRGQAASLEQEGAVSEIVVMTELRSQRAREVAHPLDVSASPCDPQSRTIAVPATQGWEIDTDSVVLSAVQVSGGTATAEPILRSPEAIAVKLDLTPSGRCLTVFGQPLPSRQTIRYRATLQYTERPRAAVTQDVVLVEAAALDGVQLPVGEGRQLRYLVRSPNGALRAFRPRPSDLTRVDGTMVLDVGRVTERLGIE